MKTSKIDDSIFKNLAYVVNNTGEIEIVFRDHKGNVLAKRVCTELLVTAVVEYVQELGGAFIIKMLDGDFLKVQVGEVLGDCWEVNQDTEVH